MTARPKQRDNLLVRKAGDEIAVYDPATGTLVQLNATAFAIWQACDGKTAVDEIVDALAELTGLDVEILSHEVEVTVDDLTRRGLLEQE